MPSVFGHSVTSLLKGLVVALMVLSVARFVRAGILPRRGRSSLSTPLFVVTAPEDGAGGQVPLCAHA